MFNNRGLLGINARNLLYIRPYNDKKAIKLADDKIKTKQFLSARGIPVPKLYGIIHDQKELDKFDFSTLPNSFVLKPNNGYGGEGIIPIIARRGNNFISIDNETIEKESLKDHIRDILDGRFSISGAGDTAFFEQMIVSDEAVAKFSYSGLPDIRIVVHNLIPVMAMLRLPTKKSKGKANLHLGAVGVGIDLGKGECTHVVQKNKIISQLPENPHEIKGFKIPFWDELLHIASKVQLLTNVGYIAVDLCIDKYVGPILLEINARAGLNVQLANLAPLRRRLERIQGIKVNTPIKGVRIAKDMFGNMVEKEIEQISGKQVIGLEEEVEIITKKGTHKILGKIDTGRPRSVIDEETAIELGLLDNLKEYDDEKSTLKVKFSLRDKRLQTVVDIEKINNKKFKMIVGNRDLKNFFIDTEIKTHTLQIAENAALMNPITPSLSKINYSEIDEELTSIDDKIKLLYHLRPQNLEEEEKKFFANFKNNPHFEYPQLKFDPVELVYRLNKIKIDESDTGMFFRKKKDEILKKIALLEVIGEEDFSRLSIDLFGSPTQNDISVAEKALWEIDVAKMLDNEGDKKTSSEELIKIFNKKFQEYDLKWQAYLRESLVANCVAGKNDKLFLRKNEKFSDSEIRTLIVHEIETHILTAENGKKQPYKLLNRGCANYLTTQEGLAMYNVEQQLQKPFSYNYKALSHVIAINTALQSSFVETFEKLLEFGLPIEQAFRSAVKSKRGLTDTSRPGAFTKDYLYYFGYHQIKKFIEEGGNIRDLYIGKINLEDLPLLKKMPGISTENLILPKWLN